MAVRLSFQDQGAFASVLALPEKPRAEVQTKFHRHVEARQSACINFDA